MYDGVRLKSPCGGVVAKARFLRTTYDEKPGLRVNEDRGFSQPGGLITAASE
jgi:hypothetical protein